MAPKEFVIIHDIKLGKPYIPLKKKVGTLEGNKGKRVEDQAKSECQSVTG